MGAGPGLGRALELIWNAALSHQPDLLRIDLCQELFAQARVAVDREEDRLRYVGERRQRLFHR